MATFPFMMSGRCGIFRCLQDICQHDNRKVAYVPIYTCETVLAPFEKAGYQLKFYELDENLHSIFDKRVLDEIQRSLPVWILWLLFL